ncbi:Carboxypeptidase 2 [Lasiodiplodia hormozganensis]|uniref:Carboxypeptidase M14B n=1 Tax=Lasiodiplodia hormozganensis TaxID=869390 RepID=A0AA40D4H3_9PEZI|nr:Carboxypeptidase 2 [Lasiodiplodia hormozganensis]
MRAQKSLACVALYASLAATQSIYADNQVPVVRDEDHVAANFPEVAGVELYSPSFANPDTVPSGFANGTSGPTSEGTLDTFLHSLAAKHDWVSYHNTALHSEEGRSIPYVYLSSSQTPSTNTTSNKVRIWLQGGVHGNEPAGDQSLLALLGSLSNNATFAASVLARADILVLPRYNPDGVAYFQRYLATGFDPNRDHTKLARQQTRDIKQLMVSFAPHVGVDCHEYTATRGYGARGQWRLAQDGQFSAMKNLNIAAPIRALAEGVFAPAIAAAMEGRGLRWAPYVTVGDRETDELVLEETTADAKIGDTSVALTQAVMFLFETRGIGIADQHWQRRVATGLTMLETVLRTVAERADEVLETVESAREDFIYGGGDIVVTDAAKETTVDWQFVDVDTGAVVDVPVTFMNTTPLEANITRARPEAYVFSRAWADVAERLRVAGVEVQELRSSFKGEVEALNVTSAVLATSKYEGIARTTVTTEPIRKEVSFPPGAFWIDTKQKNIAHAFVTLEPEGIDSYATFNILPVNEGYEYPVYRFMG